MTKDKLAEITKLLKDYKKEIELKEKDCGIIINKGVLNKKRISFYGNKGALIEFALWLLAIAQKDDDYVGHIDGYVGFLEEETEKIDIIRVIDIQKIETIAANVRDSK
jgi:hypothetical protein